MALGKTIQYTPFEETSFGYGVGEIASAHSTEFPNGTDIVKITLTPSTVVGNNWDPSTGHISTPTVGTATASYNKFQDEWSVIGQRDDVDAILAALKFFPSDFPDARNWTPDAELPNVTNGAYPMDEPSFLYPIPNTVFDLRVYDGSNQFVSSYSVTWDAIDPVYGNQRPYWIFEPPVEDLSGTQYDTVAGGLVDFGKIGHGLDTENVKIYCSLREVNGTTSVTTRGSFTPHDDMYVGDKKPEAYPNDYGFFFTGSITEAQSFFDTVRYNRGTNPNKLTTKMWLKIDDGVLASVLEKFVWFSDKAPEFTTFPAQATTEETDLTLDTTGFSITNLNEFPSTDVNLWTAEISIDATGQSGIATCSEPITNGVITINSSSISNLISTIGTITFTFEPDFKDEWSFELDITATDNLYALVSWPAAQQTVNVSIADVPEYYIPPLSSRPNISWNEDTFVDFDTELEITDQAYGGTATYQYEGIAYWWDGSGWQPLTTADWTSTSTAGAIISGTGTSTDPLIITGSRSEVNDALANMQMIPDLDWTTSPSVPTSGCFALHHKVTRTDDSVVIAQEGVPGDETGEETEVRTEFNAGTAVDPVYIPSTLDFYGNELVYDPVTGIHPTLSHINDTIFGLTEETADYHGMTYSCFLYTHANPDIMLDNVIQPGDYVEDGYSDDSYTANEVSYINKTYTELTDIFNKLQVTNWGSDVYIGFYITRSDDPATAIFNQTIHFVNITFELSTSLNTIDIDSARLSYAPREDIIPNWNDSTVLDYIYYNYNGSETLSYIDFKITRYVDSTRFSGTSTGYGQYPSVTGAESLYSASGYNITLNSGQNRLEVSLAPPAQDAVDEYPKYNIEEFKIQVNSTNPVCLNLKGSRYQFEREVLDSNPNDRPDRDYPVIFLPDYDYSTTNRVFRTGWTNSVSGNTQNLGGTFYDRTASGTSPLTPTDATPKFDHLFGAEPRDYFGTKQVVFFETDLNPGDSTNTTNPINVGQTINFNTGWAEDCYVVDVFFQNNGLKFYAIIANATYGYWKLISVNTLSGLKLDVTGGTTVHITDNNEILSGCIGSLEDGEAFLWVIPQKSIGQSYEVYVHHEDTNGTGQWGLAQTLSGFGTRTGTTGDFERTFEYDERNLWATTSGHVMLGDRVYYGNDQVGWSLQINGGIQHGYAHGYYSAITPNYFVNSNEDLYRLSDYTTIGKVYRNPQPTIPTNHEIRGAKRGDVFFVGDDVYTVVYRLTK